MAFRSVGINLPHLYLDGVSGLPERLEGLKEAGADFVELWPQSLGVIVGGKLDGARLEAVLEPLLDAGLAYTVHAPLEIDLMDPTARELQRDVLAASIRFAAAVDAGVVVCHAGQRIGTRDALHSFKDQLAAERDALREAGDLAGDVGAVIAVENYYPELPILRGEVYDYSVRPSELAEQISAVDHPSVGLCLDVGHAALAARAFGFDYLAECTAAAPLVRHVHLHDNLRKPNLTGNPPVSEHTVYGLGDLHLPPGRGTIPLEETFRRMDLPRPVLLHRALPRALLPGSGGLARLPRARAHGGYDPEQNPGVEPAPAGWTTYKQGRGPPREGLRSSWRDRAGELPHARPAPNPRALALSAPPVVPHPEGSLLGSSSPTPNEHGGRICKPGEPPVRSASLGLSLSLVDEGMRIKGVLRCARGTHGGERREQNVEKFVVSRVREHKIGVAFAPTFLSRFALWGLRPGRGL